MAQHCAYCGAPVEDGFIFCEKCGKRIPVQSEPARKPGQPEMDQTKARPADPTTAPGSYTIVKRLIAAVIIAVVGNFLLYLSFTHMFGLLVEYTAIIVLGCLAGVFLFQNWRQWLRFSGALALNLVVIYALILAGTTRSFSFFSYFGKLFYCLPLSCLLSLAAPFFDRFSKKKLAGVLWCLAGVLLLIPVFFVSAYY